MLDVYEDLIGPNILCYSMAFRIKEADGKTFAGWHQDGAYNPIKPILVIGGLALSDCTVEHGCLSVIPGSHKTGTLPHEDTGNPDSILSRGQYITEDFDKSMAVNMELKAGEIELPAVSTVRRGMTMAEKIVANKLIGRNGSARYVSPGDAVLASVDGGYSHEFTTAQVHNFLAAEYGEDYSLPNPPKFGRSPETMSTRRSRR